MRTPEEIKKGLECCDFEHWQSRQCKQCPYMNADDEWCNSADEIRGDTIAYIQQLEAQTPKWISAEERLPEVSVRLLAYEYSAALLVYDGEHMHEAYYCHTTKMWHDASDEDHIIDVTHWMPLPEPPEEVEK